MADIVSAVLYTESGCRFCAAAKALLDRRNFAYAEIDVTDDVDARQALARRAGRMTLPQLFVDDDLVGGFDEIRALDRNGGLAHTLGAQRATEIPTPDDGTQATPAPNFRTRTEDQ